MTVEIGLPAPDFALPTADGGDIALDELKGRKIILYFYPKADTPGCTKEACSFSDSMPDFRIVNAAIIGVSKDPVAKLEKFRDRYALEIVLASDAQSDVTERYGAWVEKSMYGRKYMGIDRSTFLIDEDGLIRGIWRKVKVTGHVAAVLKAARGN